MKQLFELALELQPPWRVLTTDLDFERKRVDLRVGFRARSRFPCPQCERPCEPIDFTQGTWRQPDMVGFEAFVTASLPRIRCPEHGDLPLAPSWATDHVSLHALMREARGEQPAAPGRSRDSAATAAPGPAPGRGRAPRRRGG